MKTNELIRTLKLTPAQWDCLSHRLDVPECIADALTDGVDEGPDRDTVEAVAEILSRGDLTAALAISQELTFDVLADACNGATWVATHCHESDLKIANAERTADAVERKVSAYIGEEVVIPRY